MGRNRQAMILLLFIFETLGLRTTTRLQSSGVLLFCFTLSLPNADGLGRLELFRLIVVSVLVKLLFVFLLQVLKVLHFLSFLLGFFGLLVFPAFTALALLLFHEPSDLVLKSGVFLLELLGVCQVGVALEVNRFG